MSIPSSIIAGAILAGGQSRRMGGIEKSLASLAGRPLIAHVIERFRPQVSLLAINANDDAGRFNDFDLPVVPDQGGEGPLAGILAGMSWARKEGADFIATIATDTPFLPTDLVSRLAAGRVGNHAITIASSGGRDHHVIGLFPTALADDLAHFLRISETRAVKGWIGTHRVARVGFGVDPPTLDPFFNVNRPDDLAEAEKACLEQALHRSEKG